jgi:hypothetical protein
VTACPAVATVSDFITEIVPIAVTTEAALASKTAPDRRSLDGRVGDHPVPALEDEATGITAIATRTTIAAVVVSVATGTTGTTVAAFNG